MSAVAAIDIGSNSVRLLVTDELGRELRRDMNITRLAAGVDQSGRLSEAAVSRTLRVLESYGERIRAAGASRVRVTATSAARDADNREELFRRVESAVGARPELLSGEQEAALSFAGATADREAGEGPFVTLDIGGGSTEFALGTARAEQSISLDVGCVRLTERFVEGDPPDRASIDRARAYVRSLLPTVESSVACRQAPTWLGLAGTVTSLAALDLELESYDPARTHGHRLAVDRIEALHEQLVSSSVAEREALLLEPKRAGVIVGGTCVLIEIMRYFERAELVVSERDILDGLAASLR